jgi:hypothetical protein
VAQSASGVGVGVGAGVVVLDGLLLVVALAEGSAHLPAFEA